MVLGRLSGEQIHGQKCYMCDLVKHPRSQLQTYSSVDSIRVVMLFKPIQSVDRHARNQFNIDFVNIIYGLMILICINGYFAEHFSLFSIL